MADNAPLSLLRLGVRVNSPGTGSVKSTLTVNHRRLKFIIIQ